MSLIQQIGNCIYSSDRLNTLLLHVISVKPEANGCFVETDNTMSSFFSSFNVKEVIELFNNWDAVDRAPFILDMQKSLSKPKRIAAMKPKPRKYIVSGYFGMNVHIRPHS